MSTELADRTRDATFVFGTLAGMTMLSFGIAVLILAMSIGVRREQSYLTADQQTALFVAGALVALAGVVLALYRRELPDDYRARAALGSKVAVVVGVAVALYGAAAHATFSAPYLPSAEQKLVLFAVAYGLIAVGYLVVRTTARAVGWSA